VAAPLGEERILATFDVVDTDGWQDDTGFRHRKGSLRAQGQRGAWRHDFQLSGASLDQNTGGYVVGEEAFADATLRNTNPNPEAYREAYALRASLGLERDLPSGAVLGITPYARRSEMEFLQHFLPGKPLEENGQDSLGVIARVTKAGERWRGALGVQLEWADTWLTQRQDGPTVGSAFLVATRPEGQHYDYAVESALAAAFYDVSLDLSPRLTLVHSARLEQLRYDYDNRMVAGNTRDDGTACGFGGCNYSRPEDRKDRFTDQAGRLGVVYGLSAHSQLALTASAGFRAPQSTELYRLQSGQTVADLRSEFVRSFELAYGYARDGFSLSLTAFDQRAEDQVLRDAEGFNISAGKTDSDGVEGQLSYAIYPTLTVAGQVTYARHRYAFSQDLGRGEAIQKGDDVDTAPRWLGSAQLRWAPSDAVSVELENVTMGDYFMDAGNTARYDGHRVWNLRGRYAVSDQLTVALRILNLADERYAERADLAFGNERYFVGQPQRAHLSVRYDF
jgi:outer membrane receptor protein involved in Fe transport